MIVTIKSVTQAEGDYGEYLKVIGIDGAGKEVTKSVSTKFKDKWDLLQENATVKFEMEQRDKKWYIKDILPVETPAPQPKPEAKHIPDNYPGKEADDRENRLPPEKIRAPISEQVKWPAFSLSYAKDIAVAGISSGQLEFSKVGNFTRALAASLLDWLKDNG